MSLIQQLPNLQNLVAGGTATLVVPPGPTYEGLLVQAAGADALLTRVQNPRLEINGKVIQQFGDAAELDGVNTFHGRKTAGAATPFSIWLPFRRREIQAAGQLSVVDAERVTALRTGDAGPITLKFDIAAAYTTASAANLQAYAVIKPGAPEPMGLMTFIRRLTYNPAGAGNFVINDIPKLGRIMAIHVIKAANDVNGVVVKRNRTAMWDTLGGGAGAAPVTKIPIQAIESQDGDVPVAAGNIVVNFVSTGSLDDSLDVRQKLPDGSVGCTDLEVTLSVLTGGATTLIVEYLGQFSDF